MGNVRRLVVGYARAGSVGRSSESVGDVQGEVEAEAAGECSAGEQLVSGCGVAVGAVVDDQGREDRPDGQGDGPPGLDEVRVDVKALVGEDINLDPDTIKREIEGLQGKKRELQQRQVAMQNELAESNANLMQLQRALSVYCVRESHTTQWRRMRASSCAITTVGGGICCRPVA